MVGPLARRGWQVTVISRPAGVTGLPGIEYVGVPQTAAERFFEQWKQHRGRANPLRVFGKVYNVRCYGRRAAAAARDFDIIYLHNEPNILGWMHMRPGQRLVLHMHNDHLTIPVLRSWYRRTLRRATKVVFVSDFVRERALECFPEYRESFITIPNATDTDTFHPAASGPNRSSPLPVHIDPECQYVLFAGRLIPEKGIDVLVRAFANVVAQNPRARLIVTGSSFFAGAQRTRFEEELARLAEPVGSAIQFTGFLPREQLSVLYQICDVVVVPSTWQEPSGLVVLEAMASGRSVVATSVGGIPELVRDGVTGLLVPPSNPDALAMAINRLLRDPALRHALGAAARTHCVTKHSSARLVADIDTLFGSLS
jgi:spore coat protein SA